MYTLYTYTKGFTVFFAMLVVSLALAIGLSIFDLTIRELNLSTTVTQSMYAIYAADAGAECALFWDFHATTSVGMASDVDGSAFATSSSALSGGVPGGNAKDIAQAGQALCFGQDIVAGTSPLSYPWQVTAIDSTHATTTFKISLGSSTQDPCVTVTIAKYGTPAATTISSHGLNTCAGGPFQTERALQVTY